MGWGCNCIPSHCNLAPCHPQPKARGGGGNARAQAPSPPSPRRHLPLGSGSGNGGGGWQRGAPMATHRQGGGPDHWPRCHPTPWGHWGGLGGCIPTPSEFNVFASYRVTVVTRCTTEHVLNYGIFAACSGRTPPAHAFVAGGYFGRSLSQRGGALRPRARGWGWARDIRKPCPTSKYPQNSEEEF